MSADFLKDFSTSPEELERLSRTTLPHSTKPRAIARPTSVEEIQKILKQAAENRIPVYPISAGKNWGYGDACAPADGMLILDLSRMNRILEVNADLAYAVIEPGVTQGQLAAYLAEHQIPLMLDGNGAGPNASIIGNILERGFGHSRYGDRFSNSCNYEAVLADGRVIRTGYGDYPSAQAQHVYKHGFGPSLDGVLSQSNFAIVTRITIWLQPKPKNLHFFFIALKYSESIGPFMEHLRKLFLAGTLRTTIHCFNAQRLLASESRFPWDEADGRQTLEASRPDLMQSFCRRFQIHAWGISGSITGSDEEARAAATTIRRALRDFSGLEKLIFLNDSEGRKLKKVANFFKRASLFPATTRLMEKVDLGMRLLKGEASIETLKGAHWRSRGNPGATQDPLDSGSGLLWVSPVMPMSEKHVAKVLSLAEPIFIEHGFEFQVTLSCLNERAVCAVMSVCFDAQSDEERARAHRCEESLLAKLLENGYVPYRASPPQQQIIRNLSTTASSQALQQLKKAWDPSDLLAPGRYLPPAE